MQCFCYVGLKKFLGYVYTHNLGYYVDRSFVREEGSCFIQYVLYKKYMLFGKKFNYYYAYCVGTNEFFQALITHKIIEYKIKWIPSSQQPSI
jgi:hypothetical protein